MDDWILVYKLYNKSRKWATAEGSRSGKLVMEEKMLLWQGNSKGLENIRKKIKISLWTKKAYVRKRSSWTPPHPYRGQCPVSTSKGHDLSPWIVNWWQKLQAALFLTVAVMVGLVPANPPPTVAQAQEPDGPPPTKTSTGCAPSWPEVPRDAVLKVTPLGWIKVSLQAHIHHYKHLGIFSILRAVPKRRDTLDCRNFRKPCPALING